MKTKYELWFSDNKKYFNEESQPIVYAQLENFSDAQFEILCETKLKKTNLSVILALLFGMYGADRFYLGSITVGLVKIFTLGGFGIVYILDIFTAKKRTYEYNYASFMQIISPYTYHTNNDDLNESKRILRATADLAKAVTKESKNISDTFYADY